MHSIYELVSLSTTDIVFVDEFKIRDMTDRPILRVARKTGVEIFVTGDKDFLESGITNLKILTEAQFIM